MEIYKINGREYKTYELTNNELVELLEERHGKLSEEERKEISDTILARFKCYDCTRSDETNDDLFARHFGNFVNGQMTNPKDVAKKMATEHRYLQQEMFKVCIEYIKVLAENYRNERFDPRNEHACKISNDIVRNLEEEDLL